MSAFTPAPERPQARAPVSDMQPPDLDDDDEDAAGTVTVTFFTDHAATSKREERLSLIALAELIHTTSAPTKDQLPWLKLARFGNRRSKGASLRNNDNVIAFTGLEADYDQKKMSLAEAKDISARAEITVIIYPSPSYTPDEPKWRALCPFSQEYPPAERDRFMARLNGLFGGIFSRESWVLSQSYYYGRVANADHHATLFEGTPIDLADWLDAGAIGKPAERNVGRPAHPASAPEHITEARVRGLVDSLLDHIRRAEDGEKHHVLRDICLTLGGYLHLVGWAVDEAVEQAISALRSADDWDQARDTARWAIERGIEKPLDLEDRPNPRQARAHAPDPPPDPPGYAESFANLNEESPGRPGRSRRRSAGDPDFVWPTPHDFLTDPNSEAPELRHHHIPEAINDFVFDIAARMGVDPSSVALSCIVAAASVASDDWQVQPKRRDYSWVESPRLWGALLGPPSIMKTPVIAACTKPIDKLDAAARNRHAEDMRTYKQQMKAAKADKSGGTPEPIHPKLDRYLIENTTTEALSEILRGDDDARQRAPARKVLCRHDEMSEFFANLDRYNAGGKGGGDRGAYLRLWNGGRYSVDRIGRGSLSAPNWSATFLGGMQPGPIQKIAKSTAEDGLLQRFLYVVPGPQAPGLDRKPATSASDRYNALFPVLVAMQPPKTPDGKHTQVVVLHADAHQHREAVETRAEVLSMLPDTSPQLLAALGKWPGQFARLALTFHLIEIADARATNTTAPYPMVIQEQTARRAAAFMLDITLPHLLRAHRMMFSTTQTGHAEWIAGYILAERYERITSRDVVRAYGPLRPPEAKDELAAVMTSLVTLGWLEPETPANPVKPVHAWAVNPAVHVRFADRAEHEQERREKARAALAAHFEALKRSQGVD
jgi:hypothetical protein